MEFLSFLEADFFEKAGDSSEPKMWVEGVASTGSKDTDQQVLLADGFDLSYLQERGFFNWHHTASKSASAIIGEPTEARVENGQLIVKGFLYDGQEEARNVYNLARVLSKESTSRKLGFSIEGRTLAKDPTDPNRITKAQITNIAITFMPKNWDTKLGVIAKAEDFANGFEYEDSPIVETVKEIIEEDVKRLTRNEARLDIFFKYSDIDFEKADQVYQLAVKLDSMDVSQEALDKAYELLGMVAPQDLTKGEAEVEATDETETEVTEDTTEVEETEVTEGADETDDTKQEEVADEITKGDTDAPLAPGFDLDAELDKLFDAKVKDSGLLTKAELDTRFEQVTESQEGVKRAVKTIVEGLQGSFEKQVADIQKAMKDDFDAELDKLRGEPAGPRRDVPMASVIERAPEPEQAASKGDIIKALQSEMLSAPGSNNQIIDAIIAYESTGQLTPHARVALRKAGIKVNA